MKERFMEIFLEEKYLEKFYNQVYDKNIQAYLTKIDNLTTFISLKGL
jgi:hypothetical protein